MNKIVLICCVCFCCFSGFAQTEKDSYKEKLMTYMEVTGAKEVYNTVVFEMVEMYRRQLDKDLDDFLIRFRERMMKDSFLELIDMLLPIYKKHFTESDLDTVIAFYQTDVGKKLAKETPLLTKESMEIGQLWGMKIGKEVLQEMQK